MAEDNHRKIAQFLSAEVRRESYRIASLDERESSIPDPDEAGASSGARLDLMHERRGQRAVLLKSWDGPYDPVARDDQELATEILDAAEVHARDLGGVQRFSLRVARLEGGLARLPFSVEAVVTYGRLALVQVPIEDLLGLRVLDWTRALVVLSSEGPGAPSHEPSPPGAGIASGDQEVLVRLDGVVYLLRGCPLEATRRVEGPAFHAPILPSPGSDRRQEMQQLIGAWQQIVEGAGTAGLAAGRGQSPRASSDDHDHHEIPTGPVEDPDDPVVVSLVLRSARPGPGPGPVVHGVGGGPDFVADALTRGLNRPPTDRMDETSDRLCVIDERTRLVILEVGAQWYLRSVPVHAGPSRQILPMSSGINVLPNTTVQVSSRPQSGAFRPERIILGGTPSDWVVNDVRIGNRSQFSQSGGIPGEMFSASSIDAFLSLEVVQVTMDITILATFVGASEAGSPFVAAIVGTIADSGGERMSQRLARRSAMRWTPEGRLQGWMVGLAGEDENRDLDPGHRMTVETTAAPLTMLGGTAAAGLLADTDVGVPSLAVAAGPVDAPALRRVDDDSMAVAAMVTSEL